MAVYLGSSKVGIASIAITSGGSSNNSSSNLNCLRGTVTSDSDGVITFPELDFTPNLIVVWNITRIENGDGEESVSYLYDGVMLMAINNNGYWISQSIAPNSGEIRITNASAEGGTGEFFPESSSSGISVNGNIYSYQLFRYNDYPGEDSQYDITDVEFNYAIYG